MAENGVMIDLGDARYAEVLTFLYHEAELLDNGRFEEWLELLAEDLSYRMPVRVNRARDSGPTYSHETEIFADNLASLRLRVRKLGTDFAWAESPPSRTRHLISNVRVHTTDAADELAVFSYLLLYRNRGAQSTADLFSAERQDLLRRVDGGWRLARRTIMLDQAVVGARHISVFF
jgi:3-phenylpropionate/cinnamic acid dioxygenase small subunit